MATKAERRQRTINRAKAMSHPLRAAVLRRLVELGVSYPQQIAHELKADVSNVSYHMKQLVKFECAEQIGTEPVRGTLRHLYRPLEWHLVEAEDWADLPADTKTANLVESAEPGYNDFITALRAKMIGNDEDFAIIRLPLRGIDRQGLKELIANSESAMRNAQEIQARCAERASGSDEETMLVSYFQLCTQVPSF